MKRTKITLFAILTVIAFMTSSCMAHYHTVGTGGVGDCKSAGQYDIKKKQWYLLGGLIPLNNLDTKDLVGNAQNYTIRTTCSFGDCLIAIPGAYLLGLCTRTVRVSKGSK
jgi:hypothetical protein